MATAHELEPKPVLAGNVILTPQTIRLDGGDYPAIEFGFLAGGNKPLIKVTLVLERAAMEKLVEQVARSAAQAIVHSGQV